MKTIVLSLFFIISTLPLSLWAEEGSINVGQDGKSWVVKSRSSTYKVAVMEDNTVAMCYFGNNSYDDELITSAQGNEVTVRGGFTLQTPMVEVIFSDGVRDIELIYDRYEIIDLDGYPTLAIYQKDRYYPLSVVSYIKVIGDYDMMEKWVEVTNNSTSQGDDILIENLQSATFFLEKNQYELHHLSGEWTAEYKPYKTLLTQGVKTIQNKGFYSFGSSSFVIRPYGEQSDTEGEAWYGSLYYSGNWRVDFEKFASGSVQVTGGINFWDENYLLRPSKSFTSPKMLIGYTKEGSDGVATNLSSFTRDKLLNPSNREKVRPVLYNSWYATAFDVNEQQQLALAQRAKSLGVEVFVIDDGWFKGRVNDNAGLGDWTPDRIKFPNGLESMISKVNELGLDFGLWIEPEMVNPNSDLYREHPDWAIHYPNRTRELRRNQMVLNLAREDVYQYLYNSMSTLLRENNIKYIKWDMNRPLSNVGYLDAPEGESRSLRILYVENLYRLYKTLRAEFPDVWFECCAGGGGRVDLAMLSLADFTWASDNTDPVDRIFIQHSYLSSFPAMSMISWVTHEDHHHQNHSLEFKFDVAMAGVLGVGYDITQWSDEQMDIARAKIAEYKRYRPIVHHGDHYRLVSPYQENRSAVQYIDKESGESVIFLYNLAEYPVNSVKETLNSPKIKLRGLDVDAKYRFEGDDIAYSGRMLMDIGYDFGLRGAYKSGIYRVVKVAE